MDPILNWGIDVVLWLQQFSPALDAPFRFLTFVGDQEFQMLLLPLVYWCLDREAGARLLILFLLSAYLNSVAKLILDQPRPHAFDPRVQRLVDADGGGLPSGHTQGTVVVWGYIAAQWRRPWILALAAVLMIGTPLSRVYLGVHFPTDLLGGYLLGALLLWAYFAITPSLTEKLRKWSMRSQLLIAALPPLSLMLVYPGRDRNSILIGAAWLGIAAGIVLERRFVGFTAGGPWWKRCCAYVLGLAVLFSVYYGLRVLFADLEPAGIWRFARYALVGFWGSCGAPWLFARLKLLPARH